MVKAMAEKAWMDYYVRGVGERFAWQEVRRDLLKTLDGSGAEGRPVSSARDGSR